MGDGGRGGLGIMAVVQMVCVCACWDRVNERGLGVTHSLCERNTIGIYVAVGITHCVGVLLLGRSHSWYLMYVT